MEEHTNDVATHYARDSLIQSILDGLRADGKDLDALTIDDLQMVDEFHTRGRQTTTEVFALTEFSPHHTVIDLGSGIGGPARYIAHTIGCRVSGIDLTTSFVATANKLSELTGLTDLARFQVASALDTPFDDDTFDRAVTIQMQMGIADKNAFYREVFRILKPGGAFVYQDFVAGPNDGPLNMPTPWASEQHHSHLYLPNDLRKAIEASGLVNELWRDITEEMKAWQDQQNASPKTDGPRPTLGIHLVLGPTASEKRQNTQKNLTEGRIGYVQAVFRKLASS